MLCLAPGDAPTGGSPVKCIDAILWQDEPDLHPGAASCRTLVVNLPLLQGFARFRGREPWRIENFWNVQGSLALWTLACFAATLALLVACISAIETEGKAGERLLKKERDAIRHGGAGKGIG